MILARGDVEITVLIELCHRMLDRKGMPDDWSTSVVIPIFKGKGHIMACIGCKTTRRCNENC